jgi:hypothetical protein
VKASGKFCLSNPVFTNPDNYRGGGRDERKRKWRRERWEKKKREREREKKVECKNA